ncbi:MAG: AbrB/MazE/SpoVT family DNA-binding domain-containing protein [Candidatus Altiarchaeota archaeon]|nr:AbrB/MazE/SpoVT family DNA-binding domain-containing protein [Candidatus Altiarchaeota archaeon]
MNVEVTIASSKGQIVLPANLRHELGVKKGVRFAVYGRGDTVILKKLDMPSVSDLEALTKKLAPLAGKKGIKPTDVEAIIHKSRGVKA